jgi:phage gp46-like protein
MRGIDATLDQLEGGAFDIRIGFDGDIETEDFFDTAVVVSLFADRRANESEVPESSRRRGWIGNEYTPGFEMGSKLWIFEQSRLTRTVMTQVEDAARAALQWLVDQGYAVAITEVRARPFGDGGLALELEIQRSPSVTARRYFELWQKTGVAG